MHHSYIYLKLGIKTDYLFRNLLLQDGITMIPCVFSHIQYTEYLLLGIFIRYDNLFIDKEAFYIPACVKFHPGLARQHYSIYL